jgi:hypothetical protein
MLPKCQMASATIQVATKTSTMISPIDVAFCNQVREAAALIHLLGNQTKDLDRADGQGDEDRQVRQ